MYHTLKHDEIGRNIYKRRQQQRQTNQKTYRTHAKQQNKSRSFYELQKRANSLNEMVDLVWPPEENK